MISNVNDFAKWARTLMTEGGPLSNKSHLAMRAPLTGINVEKESLIDPADGPSWYGLGLTGGTYKGHRMIGHDGAIMGFFSRVTFFPDLQFGFSIMQNAPNFCFHALAWRLIDDFLDIVDEDRQDTSERYVPSGEPPIVGS